MALDKLLVHKNQTYSQKRYRHVKDKEILELQDFQEIARQRSWHEHRHHHQWYVDKTENILIENVGGPLDENNTDVQSESKTDLRRKSHETDVEEI